MSPIIDNQSNWYGPVSEGNFVVTQDLLSQELTITTESGMNNFTIPVAGTWTINFNPESMTMTIAGEWNDQPEPQPADYSYYVIGSFNDWNVEDGITAIDASHAAETIYYNAAGMKSNKPFKGMNVVVVKTANGTKTMKMVK